MTSESRPYQPHTAPVAMSQVERQDELTPHYADDLVTLHHGDCLDVLKTLPDHSVDAVVTDPPYGLEFMGKEWDKFGRDTGPGYREKPRITNRPGRDGSLSAYSGAQGQGINYFQAGAPFQRWCELWARECLRVLKPGGHMLAFGGTRTAHRLASAVEDAGFELRDTITWLYGSGFPKSLDVSKAIDKAAGVTRAPGTPGPYSARRPREDVPATNAYADGVVTTPATSDAAKWQGWGTALKPAYEPIIVARKSPVGTVAVNVLTHGTGALNIDGCRTTFADDVQLQRTQRQHAATAGMNGLGESGFRADHEQPTYNGKGRWPTNVALDPDVAAELDAQTGTLTSGANPTRRGSDKFRDAYGDFKGQEACDPARGADSGGASRFFPVFRYEAKAPTDERPRVGEVAHPTVKPLDLMRWLVRLVTPPGGLVLEPFAGSGTTAEACIVEGFRCVAIEREADYLPLILARITKPIEPVLFGGVA